MSLSLLINLVHYCRIKVWISLKKQILVCPNFWTVLYIQNIDYAMDTFRINDLFNRNTRETADFIYRSVLWLTVMSSFWQQGRSLCQCLCWGQTSGWSTPSWGPIGGDRPALVKGGRQTDNFQSFTMNSRRDQIKPPHPGAADDSETCHFLYAMLDREAHIQVYTSTYTVKILVRHINIICRMLRSYTCLFLAYQCVKSARISKVSHEPLRREDNTHISVATPGLFSLSAFQLHSSCLTFSVKRQKNTTETWGQWPWHLYLTPSLHF